MFTKMQFLPAAGLKDKTAYPTTPASEAEARAQIQTPLDQLRDFINNTLLPQLENAETGTSGAEGIGSAAIENVGGATIYEQLQSLKTQIDDLSAGSVADGAITTAKMADNAVTGAKVSAGAIGTAHIEDNAVTEVKLADGSMGAGKLADSAVTAAKLADGAVSADKIESGAVTETKIAAGAVTTTKLGTIQTIKLDTGDTLTYDAATNRFMLNVSGCTSVQLAPIVFGTGANPPAGTYPRGTVYMRREA